MYMTKNEALIFDFIKEHIHSRGYSPTYEEIRKRFNYASISSVQNYIKQLSQKGYLKKKPHLKRALEISTEQSVTLPILGSVAAGLPLEKKTFDDFIEVPMHLSPNPDAAFVVRVYGESMIEAGIHNNDLLVVEACSFLNNGDIGVISTVDEASTVKYFFLKEKGNVELRPANSKMSSLFYKAYEITVQGKVKGLIRSY